VMWCSIPPGRRLRPGALHSCLSAMADRNLGHDYVYKGRLMLWPPTLWRSTATSFCQVSVSDSRTWPTFRSWVGDRAEHPLRELLDAADDGSDLAVPACARWDALLSQVEQAQPKRWEGKRREFRSQNLFGETLGERSELVVAASLARAGVQFEFGQPGAPQPDLVLPDWGLGIEVGSRVLDGAQQLEDEIRVAAESSQRSELVKIVFDLRPLAIREKVRREIVDRFRRGHEVDEEVVPAHDQQSAVRVRITRTPPPGPMKVETSVLRALLTPHQQDVVAEIKSKVIKYPRKVGQAKSMPTILTVDVGRCGLAWLSPLSMWEQRLPDLLDEQDPYVGVAVMVVDLGEEDVQMAWAASPYCDPEVADRVHRLFVCMTAGS
jgi:hypothetical protein